MPLNAPAEFLTRCPDGLNNAILAAAHDPEAGGQILDGLVMVAVNTDFWKWLILRPRQGKLEINPEHLAVTESKVRITER